jgi:hypothetical protein
LVLTSKENSKPLEEGEEPSTEGKYLFERVSSRVESVPDSTQEEYDEYYDVMSTSPTEEDVFDSMQVKLKWSRVFLVGLIVGLFFCAITLLIVWIVANAGRPQLYLFLPWIYFIEFGLMFIFGGCIGTVKQSFTIDAIRRRMAKGEKITGADTKIAIGSAYTYIFSGVVIGIASLITWVIVK